ncbi:hypothetical protein CAEBREN_12285 [Caenorhabditis brenneri]|uniref:Nuclear receptor domain-containing protein n=1 Tax=Caenorhabditis brenneri TaxID=135651 RepID=G0NI78_CAEBE|nr:hypothetical protein CAEBREN_12285 [Caenorhabditis brenneri]
MSSLFFEDLENGRTSKFEFSSGENFNYFPLTPESLPVDSDKLPPISEVYRPNKSSQPPHFLYPAYQTVYQEPSILQDSCQDPVYQDPVYQEPSGPSGLQESYQDPVYQAQAPYQDHPVYQAQFADQYHHQQPHFSSNYPPIYVEPAQEQPKSTRQPKIHGGTCNICGDKSSGHHYGVRTCEGCKAFFRRTIKRVSELKCRKKQCCEVAPRTRNLCQYCRFQKCLVEGMSLDKTKKMLRASDPFPYTILQYQARTSSSCTPDGQSSSSED